jgi:3-oxoacyl-[acyl-carrier protein] reductase
MARLAVVSGGGTGIGRAERLTREVYRERLATVPAGRPGTPAEIAAAVGYLASADAGFTTGQILQVNGGAVLGRG